MSTIDLLHKIEPTRPLSWPSDQRTFSELKICQALKTITQLLLPQWLGASHGPPRLKHSEQPRNGLQLSLCSSQAQEPTAASATAAWQPTSPCRGSVANSLKSERPTKSQPRLNRRPADRLKLRLAMQQNWTTLAWSITMRTNGTPFLSKKLKEELRTTFCWWKMTVKEHPSTLQLIALVALAKI